MSLTPARVYTRIIPADRFCIPPAQLLASLSESSYAFWLDAGNVPHTASAWSYFGINPLRRVRLWSNSDRAATDAGIENLQTTHVLRSLTRLLRIRPAAGNTDATPPFQGGWVGYIGYECGRPLQPRETQSPLPLLNLSLFDTVLAYSHQQQRWWACVTAPQKLSEKNRAAAAEEKIGRVLEQIAPGGTTRVLNFAAPAPRTATSNFSRDDYVRAVERVLHYIAAGDIYQLNLAQRFSVPWELPPEVLYRQLRKVSPAAYGAYLGSGLVGNGQSICSISPELFLRVRGNEITTAPIKGTRPLGASAEETRAAIRELDGNVKERAELNMIVDLERNDLGRVCEFGSVRVASSGQVEQLPTLLHRVATVTGRLHPRYSLGSIIAACFPGGSITGAPKRRAMAIIDELEPAPRGPYCGAIGWIGLNGQMELSIAIRTAIHDGLSGTAHYHAGAGIVADSQPELEYAETLHKAAAFFSATNATLDVPARTAGGQAALA